VGVSGSGSKAGSDDRTATAGLPAGYTLRRPAPADLDAAHRVVATDEVAACGRVFTTMDDLAADWQVPHFALEQDAWVVLRRRAVTSSATPGSGDRRRRSFSTVASPCIPICTRASSRTSWSG
jgi:hypothetical protein